MLKKEQMQKHFIEFKNNDQEATKIIITNLMELSDNLMKKYCTNTNIETDELKSCCNIGMSNAMRFYTPNDDIYFMNYAGKCIYNELMFHMKKQKSNNLHYDKNCLNQISNNQYNEFEETIENIELMDLLHQGIKNLDKTKQTIITLYYGLNDHTKYNQTQIANLMNISQSQVQKLLVISIKDLQIQLTNNGYHIPKTNFLRPVVKYSKKHR